MIDVCYKLGIETTKAKFALVVSTMLKNLILDLSAEIYIIQN